LGRQWLELLKVAVLFVVAGLKSALESLELAFSWPLALPVALTVALGILLAIYFAKEFWKPPRPAVRLDSLERWIALSLCSVLVALQFLVPVLG
jgi:hypothetical protein